MDFLKSIVYCKPFYTNYLSCIIGDVTNCIPSNVQDITYAVQPRKLVVTPEFTLQHSLTFSSNKQTLRYSIHSLLVELNRVYVTEVT